MIQHRISLPAPGVPQDRAFALCVPKASVESYDILGNPSIVLSPLDCRISDSRPLRLQARKCLTASQKTALLKDTANRVWPRAPRIDGNKQDDWYPPGRREKLSFPFAGLRADTPCRGYFGKNQVRRYSTQQGTSPVRGPAQSFVEAFPFRSRGTSSFRESFAANGNQGTCCN